MCEGVQPVSTEATKAVVRSWFDAVNRRDITRITGLMTPDYASQTPEVPAPLSGIVRAISEVHVDINEEIAEDDRVAVRWTARGTHILTGRSVTWIGMSLFRVTNGKISEECILEDTLGMLGQLESTREMSPVRVRLVI